MVNSIESWTLLVDDRWHDKTVCGLYMAKQRGLQALPIMKRWLQRSRNVAFVVR